LRHQIELMRDEDFGVKFQRFELSSPLLLHVPILKRSRKQARTRAPYSATWPRCRSASSPPSQLAIGFHLAEVRLIIPL
jgi:hypothetical protein